MFSPIEWLSDFIASCGGRAGLRHDADTIARKVGTTPSLRAAAFERGEPVFPAVSWPPPRQTGWENDR